MQRMMINGRSPLADITPFGSKEEKERNSTEDVVVKLLFSRKLKD